MYMNDKVMDILNNDKKARKMKAFFEEEIERQELEGEEKEEARKDMMLFIISHNEEAKKEILKEIYEKANEG